MKTLNFKKVNLFKYSLNNGILNFNTIFLCLDKFFNEILTHLENTQYITFQLVYKLSDNSFRTLGYLNKINKNDFEDLKSNLQFFYQNDFDEYNEDFKETKAIIIKYRYLDMSKNENKSLIIDIRDKNIEIPTHLVNKKSLPSLYRTEDWGILINKSEFAGIINYVISRKKYLYNILQNKDERLVKIIKNDKLLIQFSDKFINNYYFIRTIKNTQFHFINNKLINKIMEKKTKFITKLKPENVITENIVTMDIETKSIVENNEELLSVISCCIYDGEKKLSFYLSDYNSSDELLREAIKSLMIEKYNNFKIYIHNLSKFDGIFILRILAKLKNSKLIPIIKDDKMIVLILKYGKNYKIIFHDSMLLLPSSLDKLSKAFNIDNKKVIFPIYWLINNSEFTLNYKGFVPNIKYFKDIAINEYQNYVLERSNIWDLKKELLNYNMIDCIALYEILIKFNTLIFEKFSLNVFNYPTLPSLAFAIYRSHFMNNYKIPKIGGKMLHDIRKSYTGGATDMYIPYGKNLYHYDINSLYPTSMFRYDMPVGNINYFLGNILEINNNPFGFFKCKITSPKLLDNPILQIKYNNKTISPLGKFTGWFFSEELFNAKKYGYQFEILEGYLFEKENIFKEYVSVLHQMKQSSDKTGPIYLIAKLLLNSLYGKFGMTDDLAIHKIVNIENLDKIIESKDKINTVELDDDLFLVSYHNKNEDKFIDDDTDFYISVGVASAITAYSRSIMTQFKNLKNNKMFYTDTDSAIMENPLPDSLVGKNLGQMVLEKEYKEFVALAPKVYGGILKDNKEITKVKGFKNKISFDELKSLLIKDKSLKLNHRKWFRFLNKGSISIKSQVYTLIPTANKRSLIYKNNILVSTKAIILNPLHSY